MDAAILEQLLRKCKLGASASRRPGSACCTCPLKTWALPMWTITANCARASRRLSSRPVKVWNILPPFSALWSERTSQILITRLDPDKAARLQESFPAAHYHPISQVMTFGLPEVADRGRGLILVISAGTSDIPVAEEACLTAQIMGNRVEPIYDVGVAGLHRLLAYQEKLQEATVFIVVAGMEGALPSVVGGLVNRPVIAVPTSIGYGASFGGIAALLGMLNSCASGVSVVNIDNGFGAGYVAALINRRD